MKGKVNADDSPAPPNQLYIVPLQLHCSLFVFKQLEATLPGGQWSHYLVPLI